MVLFVVIITTLGAHKIRCLHHGRYDLLQDCPHVVNLANWVTEIALDTAKVICDQMEKDPGPKQIANKQCDPIGQKRIGDVLPGCTRVLRVVSNAP